MVRPKILTAVDAAKTWDELTQRLDRDGIVVKLIQRGTRVQGLAFAAGQGSRGAGLWRVADPSALQEGSAGATLRPVPA